LTPTSDCRHWDDLPKEARAYLHRISELAGIKIDYVSVGPERDQMFAV
jgi:adenylosuccinate synthase